MKFQYSKNLTAALMICVIYASNANAVSGIKKIDANYNIKGITINCGIVNFPAKLKPFAVRGIIYVPMKFFVETLGFGVENYLDNYIDVNGGDVVRYKTQNHLLKDAMNYVGVDTPEKAAAVWSEGLKQRSGAIQYSVMTNDLRDYYAKCLENGHANWVTGMSSPWVEEYTIVDVKNISIDSRAYEIEYKTFASSGEFESFMVKLEVVKDGDFWRISKVNGDEMSKAYTGF